MSQCNQRDESTTDLKIQKIHPVDEFVFFDTMNLFSLVIIKIDKSFKRELNSRF